MGYPSLTFANQLDRITRSELEQFVSLLQGYLSQQHDETGAHTDLTADSVAVTGDASIGGDTVVTGDASISGDLTVEGLLSLQSRLSPAQITANQNDYAISTAVRVFLSSDAARDITGIVAGADGQILRLTNFGAHTITLKFGSVSSAMGNRFNTPTSADFALTANGTVVLVYDTTSASWWIDGV